MDRGASRSTGENGTRTEKGTGTGVVVTGKYEGTEIPDSIVPFVGIRAWLVNKNLRNEERLFSVYKSGINWPVGRRLEAQCITPSSVWAGLGVKMFAQAKPDDPVKKLPQHDAPYQDCTCGIYALNSYLNHDEVTPWSNEAILGVVLMWGHVLEGERGWRAQYAKAIALLIDSDEPSRVQTVERLAQTYKLRTITNLDAEIEKQRKLQGGGGGAE